MADQDTEKPTGESDEIKSLQEELAELKAKLAKLEGETEDTETTEAPTVESDVNVIQREDEDEEEEEPAEEPASKMGKLKALVSKLAKCLEDEVDLEDGDSDADELPPAKMSASKPSIALDDLASMIGIRLSSVGEAKGVVKALADTSRKFSKAQKTLEGIARREHTSRVDGAIASGKLTPGQRKWALSVSSSTLDGYLKTAVSKPTKGVQEPISQPIHQNGSVVVVNGTPVTLSDDDLKHAKITGLSHDTIAQIKLQTLKK